jgi:hypothetical protein
LFLEKVVEVSTSMAVMRNELLDRYSQVIFCASTGLEEKDKLELVRSDEEKKGKREKEFDAVEK